MSIIFTGSDYDNITPTEPTKSSDSKPASDQQQERRRKRTSGDGKADTPKYDNVPDHHGGGSAMSTGSTPSHEHEETNQTRQRCVPRYDYETGIITHCVLYFGIYFTNFKLHGLLLLMKLTEMYLS